MLITCYTISVRGDGGFPVISVLHRSVMVRDDFARDWVL